MSNNISNNQKETLEDRLAKRRRLRNKIFFEKHSINESDIILINHRSTTQSLDRKSSKRTNQISSLNSSTTSTISQNSELPPIENSFSKQNYHTSNNKTNSTPLLPHVLKNQSLESENEKQTSSKSLSTNEQQQNYSYQDEKPVISSTTIENSNPIQQETHEDSHSYFDEKPVITKETVTPTLPPIISPTTTEKSKPIVQNTRKNSISNRIKDLSQISLDHPSSYPQSCTDHHTNHFNFPSSHPKPIVRATSEQIISINKHKHQPINSTFAKKNSLALSYLFNKRMIDAELIHTSSLDNEQSQQKTIWD